MSNGFFNVFDGWIFDRDAFVLRPFEFGIGAFEESVEFFLRHAVFFRRVFVIEFVNFQRRNSADLDGLQCNNRRARDDSNLLATDSGVEPLAEVLFRVSDRERLHIGHIAAIWSPGQTLVFK